MDKDGTKEANIDEKLATLRFICDNKCHIAVNRELCHKCSEKNCLYFCPANVYTLEDNELNIDHENCLECGTCRLSCPKGAISWSNPSGSNGVRFRFG